MKWIAQCCAVCVSFSALVIHYLLAHFFRASAFVTFKLKLYSQYVSYELWNLLTYLETSLQHQSSLSHNAHASAIGKLIISVTKYATGQYCLPAAALCQWNTVPNSIMAISNHSFFKKYLLKFNTHQLPA